MKIKRKDARQIRIRLEAIQLAVTHVQEDHFLKERAFEELEKIKNWCDESMELLPFTLGDAT